MSAALEVQDLVKEFPIRSGFRRRRTGSVRALSGVSLHVEPGRTFGLVGETGCGKSTLGRCVVRLHEADGGAVRIDGDDILAYDESQLRALRRRVQLVFQDPYASLNPRLSVNQTLMEPLIIHGLHEGGREARVRELLEHPLGNHLVMVYGHHRAHLERWWRLAFGA